MFNSAANFALSARYLHPASMHASANPHPVIREHRQGFDDYLYNVDLLPQFTNALFSPATLNDTTVNRLGRGAAYLFEHGGINLVLRHYQRGGLVRHFNKDIYPFLSLRSTRMWREFHLLVKLQQLGLPVPTPVAARCQRLFPGFYKGDLITRAIPDCQTLAQILQQQPLNKTGWQRLGKLLAEFHRQDVYHADLNANNILVNAQTAFYLIDFDKGEFRHRDNRWPTANLARLLRSLTKLRGLHAQFHFSEEDWSHLLAAYGNFTPSDKPDAAAPANRSM